MRVLIIVAAVALSGCVSPPDDLAGIAPKKVGHDGITFEFGASDERIHTQIVNAPAFRLLSLSEASDLHRAAVLKATGCRAVNQVLPDIGRMTADLEC